MRWVFECPHTSCAVIDEPSTRMSLQLALPLGIPELDKRPDAVRRAPCKAEISPITINKFCPRIRRGRQRDAARWRSTSAAHDKTWARSQSEYFSRVYAGLDTKKQSAHVYAGVGYEKRLDGVLRAPCKIKHERDDSQSLLPAYESEISARVYAGVGEETRPDGVRRALRTTKHRRAHSEQNPPAYT